MGNPYDDYVSLLLIYVMYYTMKSVCVIAVILPKNQKTSSNMSEKNITFGKIHQPQNNKGRGVLHTGCRSALQSAFGQ